MKRRLNPFPDCQQGPIQRRSDGAWGWYNYPPIGEEVWQGDHLTRESARQARRDQKPHLLHTGAAAERRFNRSH